MPPPCPTSVVRNKQPQATKNSSKHLMVLKEILAFRIAIEINCGSIVRNETGVNIIYTYKFFIKKSETKSFCSA